MIEGSSKSRLSEFTDLVEIGKGGFGIVFSAKRKNGDAVALKKIDRSVPKDRVWNEVRSMQKLKHRKIVEYFENFEIDGETYVVMELCAQGSLRAYVKKNGPLAEPIAADVMRQLIPPVCFMHRRGVVHRDLSAGNVLIKSIKDGFLSIKLGDFGLATNLRRGETACTVVGTPGYIAPQVFDQQYDESADVFSLGGVLYTMLTGFDPPRNGRLSFHTLSQDAAELVKMMMDPDTKQRLTLNSIPTTEFMRGFAEGGYSRECSTERRALSRDRRMSFERMRRSREGLSDRNSRDRRAEVVQRSQPPHRARSASQPIQQRVGSVEKRVTRPTSEHVEEDVIWPLNFVRCAGHRVKTAGGRYIIENDHCARFEVATKDNSIARIIIVEVGARGDQQKLYVHRTLRQSELAREDQDPLIEVNESPKVFSSLTQLPPSILSDYKRMANIITTSVKSRVAKVVFRRPPQFPNAVAQLMENGDLRVKSADSVIVRHFATSEVYCLVGAATTRKEAVVGLTLRKVREVYEYLVRLENCLAGMGELTCFPHVFSVTTPEVALQVLPISVAPSRTSSNLSRRPFSNSQAPSYMPRSAPGAFARQTTNFGPRRNDENEVPTPSFKFKLDKNNRTIAVMWNDGRKLRQSTRDSKEFIFSDDVRKKEIRFTMGKDAVPDLAQPLLAELLPELEQMVFGRKEEWKSRERLGLLEIYYKEIDWERRAAYMIKTFGAKRHPGFFSSKNCHKEFDRILSTPYPGHQASVSGQFSYSHKVIVDAWASHYKRIIEEEDSKQDEEAMIEVRRMTSLIEKVMADKMSPAEMEALLDQLRKDDAEKEKDPQWCRVVSAYINRMREVLTNDTTGPISAPELPATRTLDTSPIGARTAFRSPSPSNPTSPVLSPIRSVAEALRNAHPLIVDKSMKTPTKIALKAPVASPVKPQKDEQDVKKEEEEDDVEPMDVDSPRKSTSGKKEKEPDATDVPKARGRVGRPLGSTIASRASKSQPNLKAASPAESTPEPTTGAKVKRSSVPEVKETGGKKPRNSSFSTTGGKTRKSASTPTIKDEAEEGRNRRSESTATDVRATPTPLQSQFKEVSVQTNISIQSNQASTSGPQRKALRKSSRKSESRASNQSQTPSIDSNGNVACQTSRVEFERDDMVVMMFNANPKHFIGVVSIEKPEISGKQRRDKKRDHWSDDDDVTLAELARKSVERGAGDDDDEKPEENPRRTKSEGKRELAFVVDTDDATAKALLATKLYKALDLSTPTDSPTKRVRKDERIREEMTNLKYQMNNMWRVMTDHKNSSIFAHPVQTKDAPTYYDCIRKPMDLHTLRREIEGGMVASKTQFLHKVYLMFANAIMFNGSGHEVNACTKVMLGDVMPEVNSINVEERKPGHSSRRSKACEEAKLMPRSKTVDPLPVVCLGEPSNYRTIFSKDVANYRRRVPKSGK